MQLNVSLVVERLSLPQKSLRREALNSLVHLILNPEARQHVVVQCCSAIHGAVTSKHTDVGQCAVDASIQVYMSRKCDFETTMSGLSKCLMHVNHSGASTCKCRMSAWPNQTPPLQLTRKH
eukprot:GFYU01024552.1.p1 GENE.GFYU01024552.1~~GFYU01024552.1.p1  ORF type:complete len:121 (+),score=5.72 GFYU01024552.1:41-403(+)